MRDLAMRRKTDEGYFTQRIEEDPTVLYEEHRKAACLRAGRILARRTSADVETIRLLHTIVNEVSEHRPTDDLASYRIYRPPMPSDWRATALPASKSWRNVSTADGIPTRTRSCTSTSKATGPASAKHKPTVSCGRNARKSSTMRPTMTASPPASSIVSMSWRGTGLSLSGNRKEKDTTD